MQQKLFWRYSGFEIVLVSLSFCLCRYFEVFFESLFFLCTFFLSLQSSVELIKVKKLFSFAVTILCWREFYYLFVDSENTEKMTSRKLEKTTSIDAQLRLLAPSKVSDDDKLVEYDALLLDRFLDILQDLHGHDIRETVLLLFFYFFLFYVFFI